MKYSKGAQPVMSKQVVLELGSHSVRVGFWDQSFIPPIDVQVDSDKSLEDQIRGVLALLNITEFTDVLLLLIISPKLHVKDRASIYDVLFGELSLSGALIVDSPLMAAYACNQPNSIVIDIGHSTSTVALVSDAELSQMCVEVLANLEDGAPDADFISQTVHAFLLKCEPERRPQLLDSIIIAGGGSKRSGVCSKILEEITKGLALSEYSADHQVKQARQRKIPDFYAEVWERATPFAVWFGGGITAKLVFSDQKAYIGREEWLSSSKKETLLFTKSK